VARNIVVENLDVIYFFYGLAFLALGAVILIQLRASEESRFRLLETLPLLGWFGLFHGAHEFSEMFLLIKGEMFHIALFHLALLFISYGLIFAFGYRLINISGFTGLSPWFPFVAGAAFVALPLYHGPGSFLPWNSSARYFLGLTGALLSAAALLLYYRSELSGLAEAVKLKWYFFSAALFFALYGVMTGLVTPAADFFPANVINDDSFMAWFGFPPQLVRAILGIAIAWSMWKVIDIFNREAASRRRKTEFELTTRTVELAESNKLLTEEAVERRRREQLSDSLNEINAAINSSLDFDGIMNRVVVEATRALGCEASMVMLREDGRWMIRYLYGLPPTTLGKEVRPEEDRCIEIAGVAGKIHVCRDVVAEGTMSPAMAEEFGTKSCVATPLKIKDQVIGILDFSYSSAAVGFTAIEVDFAAKLAAAVSLAAENSRLYAAERDIAGTLQEALLSVPEKIAGFSFGHLYRSGAEIAKVGGDFYDIFEIAPGTLGLIIGDVSGKGLHAATLTSLVRSTIRAYAYEHASPAAVINRTNHVMIKTTGERMFATVFFGKLDIEAGTLTYCCAGHPPPLIKRRGRIVSVLETPSPAVGVLATLQYADRWNVMTKGDTLVLYTDGLIEARCNGALFGEDRLRRFIETLPALPADRLPQAIFDETARLNCRLTDDLAIVALALE
jgi:serine phosphatase RsbU (regulator of sigma subunit)